MKDQHILIILAFLLTCTFAQNVSSFSRIDPLVNTTVGLLRGVQASDGDYAMFTGIPYALVDKNNPFGAALPHPGFDDVFEANRDSGLCPQIDELNFQPSGTLDCLNLNVYVPNTASSRNRLPVLVWIHGGGFALGQSGLTFYGPKYLVRHDVIFVSLNYRLGPYGFMCLHTPDIPGNQGLKDQLLALKWVKANIEAFGGDAGKVTIMGQSAGGVSVDFHLYYSDEELFDKVILQSGTALCAWSIYEPDLESPIKLANYLGFETDSIENALSFISETDPIQVITATAVLNLIFMPCVEKDFNNVNKFVGVHPINTGISRNDYSVLIGHTNDESIAYGYHHNLQFLRDVINVFLTDFFNFDADELIENEQLLRRFYIGDEEITEDVRQPILDFDSDTYFVYPTARSIPKFLDNGANSVFHYVFSYSGERNFFKILLNSTSDTAAHADEIGYLFTQTFIPEEPSPEDQIIIDRITTLWTNFAKYGNPTPETSELLPFTWPPVTKETYSYIDIDSELSLKRKPLHERMAFWDLFYELNQNAQKGYQENV